MRPYLFSFFYSFSNSFIYSFFLCVTFFLSVFFSYYLFFFLSFLCKNAFGKFATRFDYVARYCFDLAQKTLLLRMASARPENVFGCLVREFILLDVVKRVAGAYRGLLWHGIMIVEYGRPDLLLQTEKGILFGSTDLG